MSTWTARRSGARVLCGRNVSGRYVCQGEIARINRHGQAAGDELSADPDDGHEVVFLMPGYVEDPPLSGTWRPSARRRKMTGRGQSVTLNTDRQVGQRDAARMRTPASTAAFMPMRLPFRLPCPHCGMLAEVPVDVLSS